MDIQLSVIIWTVICFGILMLVLDRLLFRPLLKLMDERKERVESARKNAVEAAKQAEALRFERIESEKAERQRLIEMEAERVAGFRQEAEAELRALSKQLEEETEASRREAAVYADEALASLSKELDEAALRYSQKLIKGGKS